MSLLVLLLCGAIAFIVYPLFRTKASLATGVCLALFITIFSSSLYYHFGRGSQLPSYWQLQRHQLEVKKLMKEIKTPQQVILKLKKRLQEEPESAKGWFLLGRLYFTTRQFSLATNAFSKANQLKPNDTEIMMHTAQSLYLTHNNVMTQKVKRLLQAVLKNEPKNPLAINLLAIDAYSHHHYQKAINFWGSLLTEVPPGSEDDRMLRAAIARARENISGQKHKTAFIKVHVTLSSTLKKQLDPETTVFIYAKAHQGMPMPLAIERHTVADLPITITLDDSKAMNPMAKLSNFKDVDVIARISKSGNAMPQADDIQVRKTHVVMGGKQLELSLSAIIKQ